MIVYCIKIIISILLFIIIIINFIYFFNGKKLLTHWTCYINVVCSVIFIEVLLLILLTNLVNEWHLVIILEDWGFSIIYVELLIRRAMDTLNVIMSLAILCFSKLNRLLLIHVYISRRYLSWLNGLILNLRLGGLLRLDDLKVEMIDVTYFLNIPVFSYLFFIVCFLLIVLWLIYLHELGRIRKTLLGRRRTIRILDGIRIYLLQLLFFNSWLLYLIDGALLLLIGY